MPQFPRILVVDDDSAVRRFIRACLERNSYSVFDAENVEGAMSIFEQYSEEIVLVLSDLRMPGTDGNELVRRIHQLKPSQRVLFVTSYGAEVDDSVGRIDTLAKPFSVTQLLRKVAAHSALRAAG